MLLRCAGSAIVLLGGLFSASVWSSEVPDQAVKPVTTPAPVNIDPVSTGSIMQMLLGLLLVVGLILLLAWLLRRFTGLQGQHRAMQVVASLPLSAREKLVLVQVGDKQVLLGVAPGRVSHIESYEEPLIQPGSPAGEFAMRLQQVMQRKDGQ